jgi:hypothetical protein
MTPSSRLFHLTWIGTLALKLALAAWFPVFGDEAYYLSWAREWAGGYYDHPPMVAWMAWSFRHLSSAIVVQRLPAVVLTTVLGFLVYRSVRRADPERARYAAVLYWLAPIHVLPVMMTPDIGLLLFGASSIELGFLALQGGGAALAIGAGAMLGLAFLSKYFALLVGLAFLVYGLVARDRRRWAAVLGWAFVGFLPFLAFHLYWNQQNCWANLVFHASNRNIGIDLSATHWGEFLLQQIYLATPFLLFFVFRRGREVLALVREPEARYQAVHYLVPILIFGLSALRIGQGVHWSLLFYVPYYVLVGRVLEPATLKRAALLMMAFLLLHLAPVTFFAGAPLEFWRNLPRFRDITLFTKSEEVAEIVRSAVREGDLVAAENYSMSSVLEHHLGTPVMVFGTGSKFGRQDDLYFDFKKLDGRDVLVFVYYALGPADLAPYFESVEESRFTVRGVEYHLYRGRKFRFAAYRERVLREIQNRYYRPPAWAPPASCPFLERNDLLAAPEKSGV